jgi:hypothetical protein
MSLTPIYSDPARSVPSNAAWTLFMLGDADPLLRRDRWAAAPGRACDLSRSERPPG